MSSIRRHKNSWVKWNVHFKCYSYLHVLSEKRNLFSFLFLPHVSFLQNALIFFSYINIYPLFSISICEQKISYFLKRNHSRKKKNNTIFHIQLTMCRPKLCCELKLCLFHTYNKNDNLMSTYVCFWMVFRET